jgi:putative long chain acyl-CoA synthase
MSRITNGRWVTSAFGTASSAALSGGDTVYSVTPLYHPSGLMMSIGGAIAGGARLAMATRFEPSTFWEEVRRYGVTVASYTWTLLHDLVEAPPQPGERHHPVRLFIGSGMPRGLWRRVERRFAPARVLEFYASTETGAILVNLRDVKPGSLGRPLPGSPEVRIAAYDAESGQLVLGEDGFVKTCGTDEVGILLARTRTREATATMALRGVFSRGDAWLATGDLFRRDAEGDYWRVDGVREFAHGRNGPIYTTPIRDALCNLPAIDLAVAYAVSPPRRKYDVVVAAVTLREGYDLTAEDLVGALDSLDPGQRPEIVQVLDAIPVTTWFRPLTGALREAGIPEPGDAREIWKAERGGRAYTRLEARASPGG